MYIMDHVRRDQIGRSEPLRLLFIGLSWTFGPIIGVYIDSWGGPWAPFAASAVISVGLLTYFLVLRFSNQPAIGAEAHKVQTVSWSAVQRFLEHGQEVASGGTEDASSEPSTVIEPEPNWPSADLESGYDLS